MIPLIITYMSVSPHGYKPNKKDLAEYQNAGVREPFRKGEDTTEQYE